MKDESVEALRNVCTFDVAYLKGLTHVMHHQLKPVDPSMTVVGRAFTVESEWIPMNVFEQMGHNDVVVWAGCNETHGVWDESVSNIYGVAKRISGVVIDGGAMRVNKMRKSEFPVFSRFITPLTASITLKDKVQIPITCAGAPVRPGDIIVGDADGVVVIPRENEAEVAKQVEILHRAFDYAYHLLIPRPNIPVDHPDMLELWKNKDARKGRPWEYYSEWNEKLRQKYGEPEDLNDKIEAEKQNAVRRAFEQSDGESK